MKKDDWRWREGELVRGRDGERERRGER